MGMNGSLISEHQQQISVLTSTSPGQSSPGDIIRPGLVPPPLIYLLLSVHVFTQRLRIVAHYPRLLFQVAIPGGGGIIIVVQ